MSKKSKRKANLKASILVLLLLAILLMASTYAWFTSNTQVTISTLNVNVEAKNGLQISADGTNWKTILETADIDPTTVAATYPGNTNQIPTIMEPVSSAGNVNTADGTLNMFYGMAEADETSGKWELTATKETDAKGTVGKVIKIEEKKKKIISQIIEGTNKNVIEIPVEEKEPEEISIEKIYKEIYKEPKDAYYTTEPFTIYPHEDGVDFAITMEEAKKLLEEEKQEYEIPLKYTSPEKTTHDIGTEAFLDLISRFSTKYDVTLRNRTTNLELASNKINGYVLLPGEEFSYNKVVGERTIAAGYKEAAMYSGGEVVDGLGGGICQISSTLYNVVVKANLEVTQRSNHQFVTSYVDAGKDATVV